MQTGLYLIPYSLMWTIDEWGSKQIGHLRYPYVQTVTSSTVYSSGSNIFGNSLANTQTFTGSLLATGSNHTIFGNIGIGITGSSAFGLDISGSARAQTNLIVGKDTTTQDKIIDLNIGGSGASTGYIGFTRSTTTNDSWLFGVFNGGDFGIRKSIDSANTFSILNGGNTANLTKTIRFGSNNGVVSVNASFINSLTNTRTYPVTISNNSTGPNGAVGYSFNSINSVGTEYTFATIEGYKLSNWSGAAPQGKLTFNVTSGSTTLIEAMSIFPTSNVAIGTSTDAGFKLDISGSTRLNGNTIISGSLTVTTGSGIELQVTNTGVRLGNIITDIHTVTGSLSVSGSLTATSFTGSLLGTATTASYVLNAVSASFATNATSASFVNTLNQSVIISGSLTVGQTTTGASENTLTLGPAPAGGAGEGGQLLLAASGGLYASASMLDNWQNQTRLLRGTNAGSSAVVASWNMHTSQMALPAYNSASAFVGTAVANLSVDSGGNILTTAIGSSLTGGATNYIARWSSSTTLTTGSLFDNGTNVGIGSISPAYKLDVVGDIRATGAVYANANGAMYFRGGDDAELWDINVANTVGVYGQQDQTIASIKLGSGGGTISGRSGNIGVNTITPNSASLHVGGNVFATSFTGSLFGTASFAATATTSSFALVATSASFAATSSFSSNFTVANTLILDATLTDYASVASSIVGSNNIFTQNTGSYTSAFFKYTVRNGANTRAGEAIVAWNGTTVSFTDSSTVDIGSTSAVTASAAIVAGQIQFNMQTNSSGWNIKSIGTFM